MLSAWLVATVFVVGAQEDTPCLGWVIAAQPHPTGGIETRLQKIPCGTRGALPLASINRRTHDQRPMEARLKTLNRPPPTPYAQLLGMCLIVVALVTDALAMYYVMWGRFWRCLACLVGMVILIYLGLTEFFFGDGPLSSFLW